MLCLEVWPPVELLKPRDVNKGNTNNASRKNKRHNSSWRLKRLSENQL